MYPQNGSGKRGGSAFARFVGRRMVRVDGQAGKEDVLRGKRGKRQIVSPFRSSDPRDHGSRGVQG